MPIELTREGERFAFSNHHWEECLTVAKEHGWIPQDAPCDEWERAYFAANGDVISERDALALSAALALALPTLPEPLRAHCADFLNFCERGAFRIE